MEKQRRTRGGDGEKDRKANILCKRETCTVISDTIVECINIHSNRHDTRSPAEACRILCCGRT